jgi:hypothetical protein
MPNGKEPVKSPPPPPPPEREPAPDKLTESDKGTRIEPPKPWPRKGGD